MEYSIYNELELERLVPELSSKELDHRSPFRRDYARLIHSPSFRRLQGKTQLFPGLESDFFRSRLTHSLEVARIAKSIAIKLNQEYQYPDGRPLDIDLDLIEFAGLAHDIGHPPFGHQGEKALDEMMRDDGGFEGNAQTLRILSKLEKKAFRPSNNGEPQGPYWFKEGNDERVGLNLTYRSLASIIKYDQAIPNSSKYRNKIADYDQVEMPPIKGYFLEENDLVNKIKEKVLVNTSKKLDIPFKTIETQIMDIADDIAYSTYDLEDSLKARFLSPLNILFPSDRLKQTIVEKINAKYLDFNEEHYDEIVKSMFLELLENNSNSEDSFLELKGIFSDTDEQMRNGFQRRLLASRLVKQFVNHVKFEFNPEFPALSKAYIDENVEVNILILKYITYESQVLSNRVKIAEFRGKEIVQTIFKTLIAEEGYYLLPEDIKEIIDTIDLTANRDEKIRKRFICDFIAGMTDRYAIEFYGRLKSENPKTIFKPI